MSATTLSNSSAVADALHSLGARAAEVCDDARTRAVLAVVVQQLEHAAGSDLGDTSAEPLVVLQRRLGRASRLLSAGTDGAPALDVDHVRALVSALQSRPLSDLRPDVGHAGAVVLAGC